MKKYLIRLATKYLQKNNFFVVPDMPAVHKENYRIHTLNTRYVISKFDKRTDKDIRRMIVEDLSDMIVDFVQLEHTDYQTPFEVSNMWTGKLDLIDRRR